VAVTLLVALLASGVQGCAGGHRSAPPAGAATSSAAPVPPTQATSPGPSAPAEVPGTLRTGDRGDAVLALQRRLVFLGYWLGEPDGFYGSSTAHAVTAFQKLTGLARDGVAGPATRSALGRAGRPVPRAAVRTGGSWLEVDLTHQVLLLASIVRVEWVFDASTGARAGTTPRGQFRVYRRVDGFDRGPLGVLYRPAYFAGGVAVHGYPQVPPYPASHGCVRVTNAAVDRLWANGGVDIGRPVHVY
jgi:peptidoglycan hydrolase-like protein with peptidoglycan-binding domain